MKVRIFVAWIGVVLTTASSPGARADLASTRAEALKLEDEIGEVMTQANADVARYVAASEKAAALHAKLDESNASLRKAAAACARGCSAAEGQVLANATKQSQEAQMSFNMQYLQLQSQMQNENRSYTAVSNIMKTKHDTVKNSISNIH